MATKKLKDPKERIIDAAAALFAQQGFAGVGVREIARKAKVNISMISYYFNGKVGILKAIIEKYFLSLREILNTIKEHSQSPEEKLRLWIKSVVSLVRSKPNLCRVSIFEMPFNMPEVREFKEKLLLEHLKYVKSIFHKTDEDAFEHEPQNLIIGPALFSMIMSNFFVGHLLKSALNVEFDDEFYERYTETITNLSLYGITGLSDATRRKMIKINP